MKTEDSLAVRFIFPAEPNTKMRKRSLPIYCSKSNSNRPTNMSRRLRVGSDVLLKIKVGIHPSSHKNKSEHTSLHPFSGGGYMPL